MLSDYDKFVAKWWADVGSLSPATRHTVELVIKELKESPNSTHLDLRGRSIVDVTPLFSLTNLTGLCLDYNQIENVTPLLSLTNLTWLSFWVNHVVDVTPLSGLTNLTELYLSSNQIVDVTPLSGLTNLTELELECNQIVDVTPLSGLTNLTSLSLSGNKIVDVSPLFGLTNLRYLSLDYNQIENVTPLLSLTKLTALELGDNRLPDLSPLLSLSNLNIAWNCVTIPRKYWQPIEKWQSKWILEETNAELRRVLIQQIGYEKITQDLSAIELDTWREYSLLKIPIPQEDEEDIYLLKMTCPSTGYIHILRVPPPPEVNSALEAITWVNWGINPEDFAIET